MNVIFRVDASIHIGSGHVMRCLTLADRLQELGANVGFICKEFPGNLIDFIRKKNRFTVYSLPDSPPLSLSDWSSDAEQTGVVLQQKQHQIDWLVEDHYTLGEKWENQLRLYVKNIMVIDDLANRKHNCDILLDQNWFKDMDSRYDGLVPARCIQLLGPQYALLRKEFSEARKSLQPRNGKVRRILIFFGNPDPTNETAKALKVLQRLPNFKGIKIDVIIGEINKHRPEIEHLITLMPNTKLYVQADNMAELMVAADLALGACGSTIWERHFLGLPTISIITADNQIQVTEDIEHFETMWNLGWHEDVSTSTLATAVAQAVENPKALKTMSEKALTIFNNYEPDWLRSHLFIP
jgi:UDP-2,4-diacetamido-2,4,6-trideoxy-beta-L-altropyranose hydrolase